ncbi:MAG TPA: helix-turn-helix domain-containing protein [bacterium]|nr:helix-turn-helix domain-containing protein [bacterium]
MDKEILDIRAAANFLGIKKRTMYKLVNEGEIPAKKIGGQWRFSKTQLISLFDMTNGNGEFDMTDDQ